MLDISPVLDFVSRTGEHCVFFNPEDRGFFVVTSFKQFERMMPKRMQPGVSAQPISEEQFVEPWATNTPSFSPEPSV
mgnify:FL=1